MGLFSIADPEVCVQNLAYLCLIRSWVFPALRSSSLHLGQMDFRGESTWVSWLQNLGHTIADSRWLSPAQGGALCCSVPLQGALFTLLRPREPARHQDAQGVR